MNKVYKIVRRKSYNTYLSYAESSIQVEYGIYHLTTSPFGPLFAFDSLESAMQLMTETALNDFEILKCDFSPFPYPVRGTPVFGANIFDIRDFWQNVRMHGQVPPQYSRLAEVLKGTVFCEWIYPTNDVSLPDKKVAFYTKAIQDDSLMIDSLSAKITGAVSFVCSEGESFEAQLKFFKNKLKLNQSLLELAYKEKYA